MRAGLWCTIVLVAACSDDPKPAFQGGTAGAGGAAGSSGAAGTAGSRPTGSAAPLRGDESAEFPTVAEVYGGAHGMYRGCGPNGGVCHNGREFPDFRTLGSILQNIDLPCNQKRDAPAEMHDLCEREGDLVRVGSATAHLGYFEAAQDGSRKYRVSVREPLADSPLSWSIVRADPAGEIPLLPLTDAGVLVAVDPADRSSKTLILTLPEDETGDTLATLFASAGVAGDPTQIQLGDPNRNGTFGFTLGGRLIRPGAPDKSYLIKRLTDPTAGPLMPRANCCFWTKPAVRALWCWIAGLRPDGSNAMAPIDYGACPDGPPFAVKYPDPGPACETSGMCPVMPDTTATSMPVDETPSFSNIYRNIFMPNCSGSFCHVDHGVATLDMRNESVAYRDVRARVMPGNPAGSKLHQRLDPAVCRMPDCATMPLNQPPLSAELRGIIDRWIMGGALER